MNKQLDMKRITILIVGSRGDLQPFLALGVGLQRFGHSVKIAAPLVFEGWIRNYGLDYAPVRFNPQEYLKNPEMQKLMQSRNLIRLFRDLERLMESKLKSMFIDFWQASQGADAILCQAAPTGACDCAEKLGVPYVCGQLLPVNPTHEFPCISMPPIPLLPPFLRGCYNRLTHLIVEQGMWMGTNRPLNRWREQTLHLPPISFSSFYAHVRARRVPILFGYSPAVVPRPKDWADWQYVKKMVSEKQYVSSNNTLLIWPYRRRVSSPDNPVVFFTGKRAVLTAAMCHSPSSTFGTNDPIILPKQ